MTAAPMQTSGKTIALYAILAAVISLGLLVFAYFASDTSVTDVVIGAVTGFWLREATYVGKAVTTGTAWDSSIPDQVSAAVAAVTADLSPVPQAPAQPPPASPLSPLTPGAASPSPPSPK